MLEALGVVLLIREIPDTMILISRNLTRQLIEAGQIQRKALLSTFVGLKFDNFSEGYSNIKILNHFFNVWFSVSLPHSELNLLF